MPKTQIESADALIEQYIEPNRNKQGKAFARLRDYGISVWALIGWLADYFSNADQVASNYAISARSDGCSDRVLSAEPGLH